MFASRSLLVATALSGALVTVALAASLAVAPATLGARSVATPRCTAAGLSVLQVLSAGAVVSVTVGNLTAACGLASLQVTVNNGAVSGSGTATVPAAGGSMTINLSSAPAVTVSEETDLVITGP
jgi:hypothetical protein